MTKPRVVVPQAMRYLRLRPDRKYTRLGSLAQEIGWKHSRATSIAEKNRLKSSAKHHQRDLKAKALLTQAKSNVADKIASINADLAKLGY